MKILSWNVNGLRAAMRNGMADWLDGAGADVVGLQEVRATREQVTAELERLERSGWDARLVEAERKGYSGVGLLTRRPPDSHVAALGVQEMDAEGRLQIAELGGLVVANAYFPNGNGSALPGGKRSNDRVPFKLAFYRALFERLEDARAGGRPVLVMGDFNTAHRDIDLARPKTNRGTSGFLPEEREELDRWLRAGWTDTFRHVHGDVEGRYSWWAQRAGCRERNVGWRIDYVLASQGALPYLEDAFILAEVRGSDHCPVGVRLDPDVISWQQPA